MAAEHHGGRRLLLGAGARDLGGELSAEKDAEEIRAPQTGDKRYL